MATRPVQEMSDTAAALRAAKEVQADTLAPELFRLANENFNKAQNEYKAKNFKNAKSYAERARFFAEKAEFESLRQGGKRGENIPDPLANSPAGTPYPYPEAEPRAPNYNEGQQPPGAPTAPPPSK